MQSKYKGHGRNIEKRDERGCVVYSRFSLQLAGLPVLWRLQLAGGRHQGIRAIGAWKDHPGYLEGYPTKAMERQGQDFTQKPTTDT